MRIENTLTHQHGLATQHTFSCAFQTRCCRIFLCQNARFAGQQEKQISPDVIHCNFIAKIIITISQKYVNKITMRKDLNQKHVRRHYMELTVLLKLIHSAVWIIN